jgi:hypothetical protein
MQAFLLAVVLAAVAQPASAPGVQVDLAAGRMSIKATNASIPEILAQVATQTGMKVIYDGPPPHQRLKLALSDRTPADAVLGVLEGRGLNFAVVLNAAGTQVETLLISTALYRPPPARAPAFDMPAEDEEEIAEEQPVDYEAEVADGEEEGEQDEDEDGMPPERPDRRRRPPTVPEPGGTPIAVTTAAPPPTTLPTPEPPSVSPFTPQGPGPIILPIPGSTPTPGR